MHFLEELGQGSDSHQAEWKGKSLHLSAKADSRGGIEGISARGQEGD